MVAQREDPARAPHLIYRPSLFQAFRQWSATRSQSVGPGPTPPNRRFPLSHLFALSPQSERLEHANQPEARRAKRNYFLGRAPLFG